MKPTPCPLAGILRAAFAAAFLALATLSSSAADDAATRAAKSAELVIAEVAQAVDKITAAPGPDDTNPASAPMKQRKEMSDHEKRMELIGLGLGCVVAPMGIGIAFFAIWIDYRKRHEVMAICHQERMAALEKGLELPPFPPEFCQSDINPKPPIPGTGLKPGLMWLATGVGLWLFLSPKNQGLFHPSVGAIPAAVGVAHLVYFAVEGRKLKRRTDEA